MKLVISRETYCKVMHWVNTAKFEVSGFGTVTYDDKNKIFRVEDAFLVKQEGSAAETELDAHALGRAMYEVHQRGLKGELKWWWHSHVMMATFWSGQDRSTISDLAEQGWCVATVFNQKDEHRTAWSCPTALGNNLYFEDQIGFEIEDLFDASLVDAWTAEFDAKVAKAAPMQLRHFGKTALTQGLLDDIYENSYARPDVYDARTNINEYDGLPISPELEESLKDEAKALGMGYKKYKKILFEGTHKQLEEIENRLLKVGMR